MLQKSCIDFALNAKPIQRCKPKQEGSLRYRIWQLCTSSYFEFCIMVMIALNTCVLMAKVNYFDKNFGREIFGF